MNKIYRVIFNRVLGFAQVASEHARSLNKNVKTTLTHKNHFSLKEKIHHWGMLTTVIPVTLWSHASAAQTVFTGSLESNDPILSKQNANLDTTFDALAIAPSAFSINACNTTNTMYGLCFVGANQGGIGTWQDIDAWQRPTGEFFTNPVKPVVSSDPLLITGRNTVLTINSPFMADGGYVDPLFPLLIEDGARLVYEMPFSNTSAVGKSYKGDITLSGSADAITTLDLRFIGKGHGYLRATGTPITMNDYSRLSYDNPTEHETVNVIAFGGLKLAGQHLYFDVMNGSYLNFLSDFFRGTQFPLNADPTVDANGKATREIHINQGENGNSSPGNGTFSIPGTTGLRVGKWTLYGGKLRVSGEMSLGLGPLGEVGNATLDFNINPLVTNLDRYADQNIAQLEILNGNSNFNNDFIITNANTLAEIIMSSNNYDVLTRIEGSISGDGGIIYSPSSQGVPARYELAGKQEYKGNTYVGTNTQVDYIGEHSVDNLSGNIYGAVDSRVRFFQNNTITGDILYNPYDLASEAARASGDFKRMEIHLGDRQSADALKSFSVNLYGYIDSNINVDILNDVLTLHSGFVGDTNANIPFANDPTVTNRQDGVYGAKRMVLENTGVYTPQYVSSQSSFIMSEFDSDNPWDIFTNDLDDLTETSSAAEWQARLDKLAKDNPTGFGVGSTLVLDQRSIIGATGVVDALNDEVLFNGNILPSYFAHNGSGLVSTINYTSLMSLTSKITKTGNGRTVMVNPHLSYSKENIPQFNIDIGDYENKPLQQQLNIDVQEGILDWRLNVPYNPLVDGPRNPNVMVVLGNYQTQAGATTAISDAATFLRIQKFDLYPHYSWLMPKGVYMPGYGDFILAGKRNSDATATNNGTYDASLDSERAKLDVIAGGGELAEIYAEGKVDIQGALLSVTGLAGTQGNGEIKKSSQIKDTQYTLIHTEEGFVGGEFIADENGHRNNATAIFANSRNPAAFVDYLTGGDGFIINCNYNVDPSIGCLIDKNSTGVGGKDTSLYAQEYILRGLELSWYHTGDLNSITGDFTIGSIASQFEVDTVLSDRAVNDPKRNGAGYFESSYGLWDGKSLTKKGQGLLVLSAENTYTGNTNINSGRLRISQDNNLGNTTTAFGGIGSIHLGNGLTSFDSTLEITGSNFGTSPRDLVLGRANNNTIDIVDAANTVTLTGNVTESQRFISAQWYNPNGTLVADQANPPIDARKGLWADSNGNLVDQNAPPVGSILRFEENSHLIKSGLGHLVLAPNDSNGKLLKYDGDTEVRAGELTFRGDTTQVTGNLYNQGKVTFDQSMDSVFAGDITQLPVKPLPTSFAVPTAFALPSPTIFKTGTGTLNLLGYSDQYWQINQGGVITDVNRFTGNVNLNANTFLTFNQSLPGTSEYTGTILGDASSTINIQGDSGLRFNANNNSILGNVVVGGRYPNNQLMNTKLIIFNDDPNSSKVFTTQGDFTIKTGATTELQSRNSYLNIGGTFTQERGSTLNIMLDLANNQAGKADITANHISLAGQINILGFERINGCEIGCSPSDLSPVYVKASDLSGINYTLMQSNNVIDISQLEVNQNGNIDPSLSHPLQPVFPSYLIYFYSSSLNKNNNGKYTFNIDNLDLAWNWGDSERANGTFDIVGQSGFNVDVTLKDRSSEIFTGWDGKTLIKSGEGDLVLSAANEYLGDTYIKEGSLYISQDNNLGANPNATLFIGDKTASSAATLTVAPSSNNNPIDLITERNVVLGERNDNTINVLREGDQLTINGVVSSEGDAQQTGLIKEGAGDLVLNGGFNLGGDADLTIAQGKLTLNFADRNADGIIDDHIGGNILNAGTLVLDIPQSNQTSANDVTLTSDFIGYTNESGNTLSGIVEKTGQGNLFLTGNSSLDWIVHGGTLTTSVKQFTGDIALDADTTLVFMVDKNQPSKYSGQLTSDSDSTLNIQGTGQLDFNYGDGSTFGNIIIGDGNTASLFNMQSNSINTTPQTFIIQGDFTTENNSTTLITGKNSYLDIAGTLTQKEGAYLGISLDLNHPNQADIVAKNVNLGGGLEILGFSRVLCESDIADCKQGDFQAVKATDLDGVYYHLIHSNNAINGGFNNDISDTHPLNSSYSEFLIFKEHFSADRTDYFIDSLKLAWLFGGKEKGTGTFNIDGIDNAFNVDVELSNQTGPFNLGWDGQTLTKEGSGELQLTVDNTYTGNTLIKEGTLTINNDKNLGNIDPNIGSVGNIYLGNSEPDNNGQATLNIVAENPFETNREIILGLRDDNTINVSNPNTIATFNGKISGTDINSGLIKTGEGELILTNSQNHYAGKTDVIDGVLTLTENNHVIKHSNEVVIADGGSIKIGGGTDQTLNNLQSNNNDGLSQLPAILIQSPGGVLTLNNTKNTEFNGSITGKTDLVIQAEQNALDPTAPQSELTLSGDLMGFEGNIKMTHGSGLIIDGSRNSVGQKTQGNITTNIMGEKKSEGILKLTEGGTLTGSIKALEEVIITSKNEANQSSIWQITDHSSVGKLVLEGSGSAGFVEPTDINWQGRDLTIGQLINNSSAPIILYTEFGSDNSKTDKIVLQDPAHSPKGTTILDIRNTHGKGDNTTSHGIKVVDAETYGVTTGDQAFALKGGRVVVDNLYNYYLYHGESDGSGENWYLRNHRLEGFRPEVNIVRDWGRISYQLGLTTLGTYHDRVSANTDTMYDKENQPHTPWVLFLAESGDLQETNSLNNEIKNGTNHSYNNQGIQIGLDLYEETNEEGIRNLAGVYLSHLNSRYSTKNIQSESIGSTSISHDSIAGYYTLSNETQAYLDIVGQYSRVGDIKGRSVGGETFQTSGWGALISGEVGYPWHINEQWKVEPQAQLIYQHIQLGKSNDSFSQYKIDSHRGLTGRLGARLAYRHIEEQGETLDTFIRFNYWHGLSTQGNTTISDLQGNDPSLVGGEMQRNKLQFGVGISYQPAADWQISLGADYNKAVKGIKGSSLSGNIGIKLAF